MSNQQRIYWAVATLSIALFSGSFFFPGEKPERDDLPWHIEQPAAETTRVLGITLGRSTVDDAENRFREKGELALFRSATGHLSAEVYFEQINLAGLRSKVVLTLDASESDLRNIHDRGVRASATASGRKITLSSEDDTLLRKRPIATLTMIPGVRIGNDVLEKRFGKPAMIIQEPNSNTVHWIYPQYALDISLSPVRSEKQVFQFVSPKDYERLVAPLVSAGGKPVSRP